MVTKRGGGNEWRVKELEDSIRALRRSIARTQTALKFSRSRSERQHFQELLRYQQEEFAKTFAKTQPKAITKRPDKIKPRANTKPQAIPDLQRSHVLSLPPEDLPLNSFSFRTGIPLLFFILLLVGGLSLMLLIDPWRQEVTGSSTYAFVGTGITHFTAEQRPQFRVQLAEKKGNELTGNFMAIPQELEISAWLVDPEGQEKRLDREISVTPESLQIQLPQSRQRRPGLYTLKVSAQQQGQQYNWQQDFTWGVLALNADKAEYRENEEAFISMAVLDDKGKMVCDAALTLTITAPDDTTTVLSTLSTSSTKNGGITISPDCDKYAVTPLPDYYAKVRLGRAGKYLLHLTASIPDGERSINQFLEVHQAWKKGISHEVKRTAPTRIYPPLWYSMNIDITPFTLFRGTVTEEVPSSFTVMEQAGMSVAVEGDTKTLSWKEQLLIPGRTNTYTYQFIAPDISPEFYLLGPLTIGTGKTGVWKESRLWQIAADLLPTQGATILNSTNEQRNTTQSNLTVYQQSVTVGQNIKNITNWRINGTSIMLINMPFESINNTASNNAWDYSGYGYNGTKAEGITWNAIGGYDGRGAYEFDGFNDIIVLPNSFTAQPSTVLTITAWIFPKNCTNNMRIVTKGVQLSGPGDTTGQIIFDTTGGQNVGCGISFSFNNNTGTQESTPVSGRVLNPREWYFVAVTSNNTNRTTYVNGDIITSNYSNSVVIPASSFYNWTIGEVEAYSNQGAGATTVFNGTIDELRIYNRSLSHEQIIALWKNRTDLIVSEELRSGQNWSAIVTLNNGTGDGQSVLSNALRIVSNNTPTHDKAPVLNTTDLTKNDTTTNLTLYIFTRDPDLDSLKNITNWLLNGTSIMFINMPFEKLNSSTANVARDYSGYGYNGTDRGATWNATEGFDGRGAYQFDGIDDRLFLNNSYLAQPTIYLSFTAWIKQTDCTKAGKIAAKASSGGTSDPGIIVIDTSPDGSTANGCGLRFYFINSTQSQETAPLSGKTLDASRWYFIAATFNNSNMSTYINGVLWNSSISGASSIPTSGYNWSFGEREGAGEFGSWYYNGTIDDVRIFNRSLTPEQILALFNNKTNIIVSPELRSPQNWTADVTPNDGNGDGARVRSNQQIIRNNRAPTQSTPILNTTDLTKNDTTTNLTLYINVSDADGDSVKNITNWLLNGSSIMVLNMPFEGINNTASNNAWDYSGYGNNGSDNGGIVWNASGGFDGRGAYNFDSIDDQIIISGSSSLNINFTNISVEFWMYANVVPSAGESGVVNDAGAGNPAYGCTYYVDGRVYCYIFSGSIYAATAVSAGTWHHIVETFNGTTIGLYVDGTIQAATASSQQGTGAGSVFRIGRFTNFFNGTLDDVRIWNRSLSAQQILALYNNKTNLIVSQELKRSQNWTAIVTPNDGQLDGASLQSNSVLILNTPPTQSTPILNTTDLTKNDTTTNLTLYPQSVFDVDGDPVKNITNWLLNGTSIMVLNMPFEGINNTASNNAWDYSGYGNNGSDNGGIVWNASGGFDRKGAYNFDSIDDQIIISGSSSLNINFTNISVEFWMYANAVPSAGESGVANINTEGNPVYGCTYYIDERVYCYIFSGSNYAATAVSTKTWHHIVETFNGTTIGLYVDGTIQAATASSQQGTGAGSVFRIGRFSNFFNGTLDDVRIWNRSLTAQQVSALFNNRTNLIVSQELSGGQNWTADVTPNDGLVDGAFARSNQVIVASVSAANSRPTAPGYIEIGYQNATSITNRTPIFIWYNSTDADNDIISYHLQVDDNSAFNNPEINYSAIWTSIPTGSNTTYFSTTGTTELSLDTAYFWRVRANDSGGFGSFSDVRNFTVTSLLSLTFTNSGVAFGSLGQGANASTDDGDPPPIRGENRGNMQGNISINATPLLVRVPINRSNYQFKIRANESGAFDTTLSQGTYANLSNRTTQAHIVNLSWRDSKANDFLVDINLTLPFEEPAGFKQSIITFTMSGNE